MKTTNKVVFTGVFLLMALVLAYTAIQPTEAQACDGPRITPNGQTIVLTQTSNVTLTMLQEGGPACDTTSYNNAVGLWSPSKITWGYRKSIPTGTQLNLGQFNSGAELEFYLTNPSGLTFHTGPASRNPDGIIHANVVSNGANSWTVGFEDITGGGDSDYNDVSFTVTATLIAPTCTTHTTKQCSGSAVYWYNSCGAKEDIFQQCASNQICQNAQCVNITCSFNSECGANGFTGSPFCQNNNVYQNYRTYTCANPGTASSSCSNSTSAQLKSNCTGNQTCSNGSCGSSCTYHSYQQCSGNNLYWFDSCGTQQDLIQYCQNGCQNNACIQQNVTVQTTSATNISNNQVTLNGYLNNYNSTNCSNYVWFQYGSSTSYGSETTHQSQNYTGNFSQNVNLYNSSNNTYHFRAAALLCNGTTVYGQDMTFTAGGTGGNLLTINKTVRNLTSGNSSWSNTAYANPSDMLMFMITIQTTGSQDVNNVFVRDSFPANLIYKNQLVVACTSNNSNYGNCNTNNYNYSGDITSGINLNTIYAGQTVTITYQAQVASLQNFSYGTTTLNNSVTVSSSGFGNNPVSNASVSVTRSAVYGASTVATGLTDNLFVDSFVLPLMVALAGIWMFRSGMFVGVEKWVGSRKRNSREYRVQKALNARISQIKQAEHS